MRRSTERSPKSAKSAIGAPTRPASSATQAIARSAKSDETGCAHRHQRRRLGGNQARRGAPAKLVITNWVLEWTSARGSHVPSLWIAGGMVTANRCASARKFRAYGFPPSWLEPLIAVNARVHLPEPDALWPHSHPRPEGRTFPRPGPRVGRMAGHRKPEALPRKIPQRCHRNFPGRLSGPFAYRRHKGRDERNSG